jgi:hypothetical protein
MNKIWPGHPKPRRDESLSSWLLRTIRLNGCEPHSFCNSIWPGRQIWNRDIDCLSDPVIVAELARGTATPLDRAAQTTVRSLEGVLFERHFPHGRNEWILRSGVFHRTRRLTGSQFCPKCLAEEPPYFRLIWRVAIASTCPLHGIVLLDRCPQCSAPLVPHRARCPTECHICRTDLTRANALGADSIALQFEDRARKILEGAPATLNQYGEIHPLAFFALVRQVLRVLSTGPRSKALRRAVAEQFGGDPSEPQFPSSTREIESLAAADRHRLMTLLSRVIGGWPFLFVACCLEARVLASWAMRDMDGRNSPFAYADAVRTYLYRPARVSNPAEISAARAYLVKRGRKMGAYALRKLMGIDSKQFTQPGSGDRLRAIPPLSATADRLSQANDH